MAVVTSIEMLCEYHELKCWKTDVGVVFVANVVLYALVTSRCGGKRGMEALDMKVEGRKDSHNHGFCNSDMSAEDAQRVVPCYFAATLIAWAVYRYAISSPPSSPF